MCECSDLTWGRERIDLLLLFPNSSWLSKGLVADPKQVCQFPCYKQSEEESPGLVTLEEWPLSMFSVGRRKRQVIAQWPGKIQESILKSRRQGEIGIGLPSLCLICQVLSTLALTQQKTQKWSFHATVEWFSVKHPEVLCDVVKLSCGRKQLEFKPALEMHTSRENTCDHT